MRLSGWDLIKQKKLRQVQNREKYELFLAIEPVSFLIAIWDKFYCFWGSALKPVE
jgi:hypothetical protein